MKKFILSIVFLLFASSAFAQIPRCEEALKATPQGPFPCSVEAKWNDVVTETGYILERRLNGGAWTPIGGTLAANTVSVIDATLQQSKTQANLYEYKVTAVNQGGQTPGVNPISAGFTIPQAVSPPTSPTGITITFKGATGVMTCPTCIGGDRKVPFSGDSGTFDITAEEITIALK